MKNVKLISLSTGEEIICEVVGWTNNVDSGMKVLRIRRPFLTIVQGGNIGVYPWKISTFKADNEEIFEVFGNNVVMVHKAPQEMVDSYIEQTTNLAIPSKADQHLILEG